MRNTYQIEMSSISFYKVKHSWNFENLQSRVIFAYVITNKWLHKNDWFLTPTYCKKILLYFAHDAAGPVTSIQ